MTPHADNPTETRTNMRNALVQGMFWALMFGAGEQYIPLFATQLRMPDFLFGLLTGLPQLLGPLVQMAGANLVDRYGHRARFVMVSIYIQVLCFIPFIVLTYLSPGPSAFSLLLGAAVCHSLGGQLGTPAWGSLISDIVPSGERTRFFARNMRFVQTVILASNLVVAGLLHWAGADPVWTLRVFTGSFAIAGLARLVTFFFVGRIRDIPYQVDRSARFTFWQFISRARQSNFVHFVFFTALIYATANISGPFALPYFCYDLHYPKTRWVAMVIAGTLGSVASSVFWGWFSERFGNKKTLTYTARAAALSPLLWLVSPNFYYLVGINLIGGFIWAGFGLSSWNYILEAVTPAKRARCLAYFGILVGFGVFAGSSLGTGLTRILIPMPLPIGLASPTAAVQSTLVPLLLVAAACSFTVCAFLLPTFRELREVEPFSLRRRLLQWTAVFTQIGMLFGMFAPPKRNRPDPETETQTQPPPR
jgi:MFS family permease